MMLEKFLNSRLLVIYFSPLVLGLLTVFSFQPYNLTIINFFILPVFFYLIVLITKRSKNIYRKKPYKRNLFIFGLLFGFGFYLSGTSWISHSLTFDDNFTLLIPFAIILIPLFLGLFLGFAILIVGPYLSLNFSSLLIFSSSLAIADFLRSKILTGFPWNLWAYSISWQIETLQILNIIGLYAFNLLVITFFSIPAILFFKISMTKKFFAFLTSFFLLLALYLFGSYEINKNKTFLSHTKEKINIKIISPNFDLEYGLTINQIEDKLRKLIRYSDPNKNKKTLFIWPEGVFSGYTYKDIKLFKNIINNNFSDKHFIIFGINRLSKEKDLFYNSLILVDNNLEITQQYNKRKLVPFGEFLPFENFMKFFGIKKITEGYGSFVKGQKQENIKIGKWKILPLICYEVIFSELIKDKGHESNLIVNISEDGWFGNTIGPDQHFAKSIFRAIENNTFFLRAANQGISAIIDNKGKIVKQLNRNEAGNIELEVPLIRTTNTKNDLIFFILLITYFLVIQTKKKKYAK